MTRKVRNLFQTIEMSEDIDGKIVHSPNSLYAKALNWSEAEGNEVVGDADADGTTIVSLSVAAGKTFICTSLMASTNISAMINIAYGTIASHTDIYHIDLQAAGGQVLVTETSPIFVYTNSTGAAVTLLMIAPQTGKNVATNNSVNHYFDGYMGGVVI